MLFGLGLRPDRGTVPATDASPEATGMAAKRASLLIAAPAALLLAACSGPAGGTPANPTPTAGAAATPAATAIPTPANPPESTPTIVPSLTPPPQEATSPTPTSAPVAATATRVPLPADRHADALRRQALAAIARGDTAAALRDASEAVDLAPTNLATRDTRAYVRLVAGQHEQAYAEYSFIIQQGDAPAITLLGGGLASAALGDEAASRTLLTEGLKKARAEEYSPWSTDPQHQFLVTSASATLLARAAPDLAESIRSARLNDTLDLLDDIETWAWGADLAFVHEQRAAIHASGGDYESAAERLTLAIEIEPTSRRYASLGQALFYMGLYLDALRAYSTAIRLDPDNVQLYEDRAFVNGKVNQWARALADLDHALQMAPDNSSFYALRGEAHYQLGNSDAAIADFRRTLELEPAQADAALARERLAELAPAP